MRRFAKYGALFLVVLLGFAFALDWAVTSGLRRSESFEYAEWNAIVNGEASAEIIIHGSSRSWVGLSPEIIGRQLDMTAYNLGVDGYPLAMQLARHRLYQKYNEDPRIILLCLDTYSLNDRADLYNNNQFLPYLDEEIIRDAVQPYDYFQWYDYSLPLVRYRGKVELIGRGLAELLNVKHYTNGKIKGYEAQEREWNDEFDRWLEQHPDGIDQVYLERLVSELDGFLAECGRDGIMVVLIYPPEFWQARDMVNNREEILSIYRDLAVKHQVQFLDYSYDAMAYSTEYFYNSQHLNKLGAEMFSAKLGGDLDDLLNPGGGEAAESR